MATLAEILKPGSISQVSNSMKSIKEKNPGTDVARLAWFERFEIRSVKNSRKNRSGLGQSLPLGFALHRAGRISLRGSCADHG